MRHALSLLLLLLAVTPAHATILWFSGVESGGLGEFTQVDAGGNANTVCNTGQSGCSTASCTNLLISPTSAHAGCYTLGTPGGSSNAAFGISKKSLNKSTAYTRFYWYNANGSAKVINEPIFGSLDSSQNNLIVLMLKTDNTLFWCFGSALSTCTSIAAGATVLSAATWYLIETKQVIDAAVGGIEVKINGTVEFTSFATNTSGANIDQFIFGPYNSVANNTHYYLFDDIILSDSGYIGAGKTIARQGTSGTPTYDAWTKNSCTGGTIDGCWSDTPFSATKNATSATASAAQTMLVAPFGSTQTGHGSETIGSSSVINACKTSVVAKMATASSFSIRRRISGSDTDTSTTLTTSDAFYDDGYWTVTAVQLPGAEIGGVHGAGTNTMTVEDAWLQCDYSGGSIKHRVTMED